jgi:hypothetical protein
MKSRISFTLAGSALIAAAFAFGANSGLNKGESVSPFHPSHFAGPLKNSDKCFPCTFQNRPQVQVWVNGDSTGNVASIAKNLSQAMKKYENKEFKALVVFVTDKKNADSVKKQVLAATPGIDNVGMAVITKDNEAVSNYKINLSGDVKNTVLVYKNWKVEEKMVNLTADKNGLDSLNSAIAKITK